MFDPRDISSDPRTLTPERPKRDYLKERQDRTRTGSRAEFDPRSGGEDFTSRTERAVAEIGMYRTVAYKDLSEAHFDGHPYATRRAVDRMIQQGDVQEHTAKGPPHLQGADAHREGSPGSRHLTADKVSNDAHREGSRVAAGPPELKPKSERPRTRA